VSAADGDVRRLRRRDDALTLEEPGGFNLAEGLIKVGAVSGVHFLKRG
jgi:hypothetical protein